MMGTLPQLAVPRSTDLEGLESLLDLVFSSRGGAADFGLGSLETPVVEENPQSETVSVLKSQLDFTYAELQDTKQRLQAANYRLGYLEALLTAKDAQLKKAGVRSAWWLQLNRLWRNRAVTP